MMLSILPKSQTPILNKIGTSKFWILTGRRAKFVAQQQQQQQRCYSSTQSKAVQSKTSMSTMTAYEEETAPSEESHFALILGKPGGGKGTISGKILKVR